MSEFLSSPPTTPSASGTGLLTRLVSAGPPDHRRRPQHDRRRPGGDPAHHGLQPPVVDRRDRAGRGGRPPSGHVVAVATRGRAVPAAGRRRRERSRSVVFGLLLQTTQALALAGYLLAFALPVGLGVVVVGVVRRYRVARWPVLALASSRSPVACWPDCCAPTPSAPCSTAWPPASDGPGRVCCSPWRAWPPRWPGAWSPSVCCAPRRPVAADRDGGPAPHPDHGAGRARPGAVRAGADDLVDPLAVVRAGVRGAAAEHPALGTAAGGRGAAGSRADDRADPAVGRAFPPLGTSGRRAAGCRSPRPPCPAAWWPPWSPRRPLPMIMLLSVAPTEAGPGGMSGTERLLALLLFPCWIWGPLLGLAVWGYVDTAAAAAPSRRPRPPARAR